MILMYMCMYLLCILIDTSSELEKDSIISFENQSLDMAYQKEKYVVKRYIYNLHYFTSSNPKLITN